MSVGQTIVTDNYTKITIVAPEGAYAINRAYDSTAKTYTFTVIDAIASLTVGGTTTYYSSLNAAISAAPNSSATPAEVNLLRDSTELAINVGTASAKKNVVIDLGDHTLTLNRNYSALFIVRNGSNAVVKNGKVVFDTVHTNASGFYIYDNATALTLADDLDVEATGNTAGVLVKNGTFTSAADITAENSFAIATNGSTSTGYTINVNGGSVTSANAPAIYLPGKSGTANISGGTITGNTAIYIKSGTLNITGGTITGNGAAADYTYNGNGANATGDAIVVDSCGYPGGAPKVTISGNPTITSTNGKMIGDYAYGNNDLGDVTATSNALTLPEGLKWVETAAGSGVYTVGPDYAAEVNSDGYMTFAEAVDARTSKDDVITLIKAAGTYTGDADEFPIKVAMNGKTVTVKVNGAYIVSSSTADGVTTYTVTEAAIEYTTLAGAVSYKSNIDYSNMSGSGTYKLLKDVTAKSRIVPSIMASNVTVDLNGHTLTSTATDQAFRLSRAGSASSHNTFTLTDTSTNGGGKLVANSLANSSATVNDSSVIVASGNYNDITISNVTIVATQGIGLIGTNQTLTIDNCDITMTGADDYALSTNGSLTNGATITVTDSSITATNGIGVYLPGGATSTFTDTDVTGTTAMYIKSGTTTIDGGTYTATGDAAAFTHSGNGANATGDAIVVESCNYPNGVPTVSIGADEIVSANGVQIGDYTYKDNPAPAVTATSNTLTLPKGLKWVATETPGVYKVGKKLFRGHTLTLNGNIGVNFFVDPAAVDLDPEDIQTAKLEFVYDGVRTAEATLIPPNADDNPYPFWKGVIEVPAALMASDIVATAYFNGEKQDETDTYSVMAYGDEWMALDADTQAAMAAAYGKTAAQLDTLIKEMLNYGAMAQVRFASSINQKNIPAANENIIKAGYKLDNMNAVTAEMVKNAIKGQASNMNEVAAELNANYYTSSVTFLSENVIRHYFTKADDFDENAGWAGNQNNKYYYVESQGIAASKLDEQQTITINGVNIKYSVFDYGTVVLKSSMPEATKNLVKAMYLYNQAANVFFSD